MLPSMQWSLFWIHVYGNKSRQQVLASISSVVEQMPLHYDMLKHCLYLCQRAKSLWEYLHNTRGHTDGLDQGVFDIQKELAIADHLLFEIVMLTVNHTYNCYTRELVQLCISARTVQTDSEVDFSRIVTKQEKQQKHIIISRSFQVFSHVIILKEFI